MLLVAITSSFCALMFIFRLLNFLEVAFQYFHLRGGVSHSDSSVTIRTAVLDRHGGWKVVRVASACFCGVVEAKDASFFVSTRQIDEVILDGGAPHLEIAANNWRRRKFMLCDAPRADHYEAELSDFLPEPEVLHNPKFFLPP